MNQIPIGLISLHLANREGQSSSKFWCRPDHLILTDQWAYSCYYEEKKCMDKSEQTGCPLGIELLVEEY